jgi:hypothetical protein
MLTAKSLKGTGKQSTDVRGQKSSDVIVLVVTSLSILTGFRKKPKTEMKRGDLE